MSDLTTKLEDIREEMRGLRADQRNLVEAMNAGFAVNSGFEVMNNRFEAIEMMLRYLVLLARGVTIEIEALAANDERRSDRGSAIRRLERRLG